MMPSNNLRSLIAQCSGGRCVRNFSATPNRTESMGAAGEIAIKVIVRGVLLAVGYGIGVYVHGDELARILDKEMS
ncbi:unnamed protein product [Thlaspi arvense]|uniref:Uncharacterized protein n=1 Tax=Thlaspi arvense TaxID=13288 RepID=A0AAU9S423_THLAR|nr:unnamed protein product [Thlaspi arvense]